MMSARNPLVTASLLLVIVALCACGKNDGKKAASQVAARVNSEDITIYQINGVLGKMDSLDQASLPKAKRAVLEKLVDQELAVQAATDDKLDRTPEVVQAMEAARREILTRAYFAKVVSGLSKPTTSEAAKYFDEHPELFTQRRIYSLQQIVVSGNASLLQKTKDQVASGKTIQDIAEWLKTSGAKFTTEGGTRAAEQIPLEILSKLKDVKDGQTIVVEAVNSFLIAHIVSSQFQPVSQAEALPRIQQFLNNKRASEAVAEELKRLKQQAKIEYAGEFANAPDSDDAAQAAKAPDSKSATQLNMDKVLSGLK